MDRRSGSRPGGEVSWLTDRGRRRETNEDAAGGDPAREVYVVADGLGGLPGGEVASRLAVDSLLASLADLSRDGDAGSGLREAFRRADAAIRRAAASSPGLAGMGSTVVLAVAARGDWVVAHAGDSRAYLLRDGQLRPLTTDHNLAAELVAAGRITPDRGRDHPGQQIVTRMLGSATRCEPGIVRVHRRPGDRLLLCTDGLTGVVADGEIERVLATLGTPGACCRELVALANDAGGPDNVTVLVVDA